MITPILPTYNRAPMAFVRGEGSWLWAEDGRSYLDIGAGIAVNALGHANPELVAALTEQAGKLWHVSNLYRIPEQERLAEALVAKTFADTVFFTNSGTEAAELSIKMARKYHYEKGQPERVEILTFEGAFHGRSSGAIAAVGTEKMTKGFGPLLPGFRQLKWADHDAIRAAITDKTCAVMIEPVQGEGGIRVVPDQCLKGLRDLCDETGTLLIFDEVQCGMGRTGKLFAHEWAGVAPDILGVAKGLGGGFPVGACLATERAATPMKTGSHGSTFGGNPLAMAAGNAVLDVLLADGFLPKVDGTARILWQRLVALVEKYPGVFAEVRGAGMILGLRCVVPNNDVIARLQEQGLLTVGAAENVIRLLPPLIIDETHIDEAVGIIDRVARSFAT